MRVEPNRNLTEIGDASSAVCRCNSDETHLVVVTVPSGGSEHPAEPARLGLMSREKEPRLPMISVLA